MRAESSALFPIRKNKFNQPKNYYWGLINKKGEIVVKPAYEEIWGLDPEIDLDQRILGVKKKHGKFKCGFLDANGYEKISFTFDECKPFSEGLAAVRKGEKWFFINPTGLKAFDKDFREAYEFSGGCAFAAINDDKGHIQWGILDRQGHWLIKPRFSRIWGSPFAKNIIAGTPSQWGIFSTEKSRWILEPKYGAILNAGEEMLRFSDQDGKWGLMTQSGKLKMAPRFTEIFGFSEGLACVQSAGKNGFIDPEGDFVLPPKFAQGGIFQEGLAFVKVDSGLNALGGYVNPQGIFVVKPEFLMGTPFSKGFAAVQVGFRKWGLLDRRGNWVLQAKYSAIGGWHQPTWFREFLAVPDFRYGLVIVEEGGNKISYVNTKGNSVWREK